jgi:hypothetical protein
MRNEPGRCSVGEHLANALADLFRVEERTKQPSYW